MSPLYSILERPAALLLLIAALLLMIGQTASFLLSLQEKRSRRQIAAAAVHLAVSFLLFVIILDGFDNVNFTTIPRDSVQTGWFVFSLPWLVYLFWELLSAVILMIHIREYRHYKASTVTPGAIRQAIDLLPEGICVSAADGTVLLANLKMNALCRELTGERLADTRRMWAYLESSGEDQGGKRLVRTPKGEVWIFARDTLTSDGRDCERTSAVNVTERYRITEELREINAHLQDIQRRIKKAADLSAEMFIKQEEAQARSALHNQLGQVLLMGRHYIEHPEDTDKDMVALATSPMNSFLLGESSAADAEAVYQASEDALQQAVRLSRSIGVTVQMQGRLSQNEMSASLLAQAIRECSANTVKHAEGDTLYVESSDTGFVITNSGKPPKGPVVESGGLLSLRRSAEAAGWQMQVQSRPRFILTLLSPKNGTNG